MHSSSVRYPPRMPTPDMSGRPPAWARPGETRVYAVGPDGTARHVRTEAAPARVRREALPDELRKEDVDGGDGMGDDALRA